MMTMLLLMAAAELPQAQSLTATASVRIVEATRISFETEKAPLSQARRRVILQQEGDRPRPTILVEFQ